MDKIKEKKVRPKARWRFLLKNYVIWSLGVLALLSGGLAFSLVIYLMWHQDWGIYQEITDSFWKFALLAMPYFWIIILVLFITAVNYNFKHTKKGYRYPLALIVALSVVASSVLGAIFFRAGAGRAIDDYLGERAPFYTEIFNRRPRLWVQPEDGRLAGLIISREAEEAYNLIDRERREWLIIEVEEPVEIGRPVRIVGEQTGPNIFRAETVMPFGPGRGIFMRCPDHDCPMHHMEEPTRGGGMMDGMFR